MTTDIATGLLLSGPSSVGKTTLSRAIQDLFPDPWIVVEADTFGVGFPRHRRELVTLEWDHRLREAPLRAARAFTDSGLNVVLEQGLWDPWGAAAAARLLGSAHWFVVAVTCDVATAEARERARGDRFVGAARQQHAEVATSHLGVDFAVDTTNRAPDEVARDIEVWLARRPAPNALRAGAG